MRPTSIFIIGTLIGALIGGGIALLFAPSSGKELRSNIKTQANAQYARLQDEYQKGIQQMESRIDEVGDQLQTLKSRSKGIGDPEVDLTVS